MNWRSATVLATLCAACATKPVVNTNVKIDFPDAAPVVSVKQANTVLQAVGLANAQIEWRFNQKQQICATKFFMNSCMAKAKEERRIDLAQVKQMEVAAHYFIRKNNVEEMDKTLVEKYGKPLPGAAPETEAPKK